MDNTGDVQTRSETRAPAGWYADPMGKDRQRYWDGREWTHQVATAPREPSRASKDLAFFGVVFAIVMPLVGFVIGCVLMVRGRAWIGLGCLVLSIAAMAIAASLVGR